MDLWSKKDIAARTRKLRAATPNVLENLFEMQNRICDLCERPIQDLILASLEHSTPVSHFAKGSLPIEEAIRQCHHPRNLRAAHRRCNDIKKALTREDWFARGLNKTVGQPHVYTDVELLEFQFRLGAGGRAFWGRLSPKDRALRMRKIHEAMTPEERSEKGRRGNMKLSPEQRAERARKCGIVSAARTAAMTPEERHARAVKAGAASAAYTATLSRKEKLAKVKSLLSRSPEQKLEDARKGFAAYIATTTHEERSAKSRRIGQKSFEMGAGIHGFTRKQRVANGRKAGLASAAAKTVEQMKEHMRKMSAALPRKKRAAIGSVVAHKRWHANRGVTNPNCLLCREAA